MYEHGQGCKLDPTKAWRHYEMAQVNNRNAVRGMIAVLEKYGIPDGCDPERVIANGRKAIENNIQQDGELLFRLGRMYQGLGFLKVRGLRPFIGKIKSAEVGYLYYTYETPKTYTQTAYSTVQTGGGTSGGRIENTSGFVYGSSGASYQIHMRLFAEDFQNGKEICGFAATKNSPDHNVKENRVVFFYLPEINKWYADRESTGYLSKVAKLWSAPGVERITSSKLILGILFWFALANILGLLINRWFSWVVLIVGVIYMFYRMHLVAQHQLSMLGSICKYALSGVDEPDEIKWPPIIKKMKSALFFGLVLVVLAIPETGWFRHIGERPVTMEEIRKMRAQQQPMLDAGQKIADERAKEIEEFGQNPFGRVGAGTHDHLRDKPRR